MARYRVTPPAWVGFALCCGLRYPLVGRRPGHARCLDEPRSAWTVSCPGSIRCRSQVRAMRRSASTADASSATIHPTT